MKTILSLFDFTGEWARPFERAGWNVLQMDLKHGDDAGTLTAAWILENICQGYVVDGILAAPPCTDFANSGAQHWRAKDADGRTAASVHLVRQTLRTIDYLQPDFYAIENPIGRIAALVPGLGAPRCMWDPCDYASWTAPSVEDVARLDDLRGRSVADYAYTANDVELVKRTNAYTKRTVLYGSFRVPEVRRIEPVRVSAQGSWLQRLGGKSESTKAARSETPAGFAAAFYAANSGQAPERCALVDRGVRVGEERSGQIRMFADEAA